MSNEAKDNEAHYGSNYFIRFKLINTMWNPTHVAILLFETVTPGAIFIGAFRKYDNGPGEVKGVPSIRVSTPDNPQMVLIDIYEVPAQTTVQKQVIIHAGGNTTSPIGLLLMTVN